MGFSEKVMPIAQDIYCPSTLKPFRAASKAVEHRAGSRPAGPAGHSEPLFNRSELFNDGAFSMVENLYPINRSVTGANRGLWPLSTVFCGIFGVTFSRI